jgi:hypothetical protein
MTKVLFLIVSGKGCEEKVNYAIISAARMVKGKRFDEFKILLYGPAEDYIVHLEGEVAESFSFLVKEHVIDSACSAIAQKKGIDGTLSNLGVSLAPFGERLSYFISQGYSVITF